MMGLSTKQVSNDLVLDWSQSTLITPPPPPNQTARKQHQKNPDQNQTQSEPLNCPRCDSTNTKFCYFNNYNKSQPRHFCKACKRHWTKGGTLRNVPVGGGRKNKRFSRSATGGGGNSVGKIINKANPKLVIQAQKPKQSIQYQNDVVLQGLMTVSPLPPPSSEITAGGMFNGGEMGSSIFGQGLNFGYSAAGFEFPATSSSATWQVPTSTVSDEKSVVINDVASTTTPYWNWDDMDNFVSAADLNIPWDDDSEI